MFKTRSLLLIAIILMGSLAGAQSPPKGRIVGKAYTNSYFKLTYAWPAMVKPVNAPAGAAAEDDPHAYEFQPFSARQGDQPYGVVLLAHKLKVSGPHATPLKGSGDLIDRMARSLRPGPVLTNINRTQKKNARGVVFDELTFYQGGKPAAVLATQAGQYLLVFKCNAQSDADLRIMENSALNARFAR